MAQGRTIIYTDGSCGSKDRKGGWGFVTLVNGLHVKVYAGVADTTNQRMEMTAALKGLEYALEFGLTDGLQVVSDSMYVINGVTKWVAGWQRTQWRTTTGDHVKNRDLWEPLHARHLECGATWKWVKGHIGNVGNEIADRLASKGRQRALQGEYDPVLVSPMGANAEVGGMLL